MSKTVVFSNAQIEHLLKVTAASNAFPVRNLAILMLAYGTGMMLTEMALLPVSAYLSADGRIQKNSEIPAHIAYNGKARPIFWESVRAKKYIDLYLEYRLNHHHGTTTKTSAYRGLDHEGPIVLTDEGTPYKLTKRQTKGGVSRSADSLSQLFRTLHSKAGLEGGNADSARRRFAIELFREGYDLKHISVLLGHATLTATRNMVGQDPVRLGNIVANVI